MAKAAAAVPVVRVLVLPVTRRHWLYTACTDSVPSPDDSAANSQASRSRGWLAWLRSAPARVADVPRRQWQDLKAAPEGTWKHWAYECAAPNGLNRSPDPRGGAGGERGLHGGHACWAAVRPPSMRPAGLRRSRGSEGGRCRAGRRRPSSRARTRPRFS